MTSSGKNSAVIWYAMTETWHLRQVLDDNFVVYHGRTAPMQVRHSDQFRVVVVSWWLHARDRCIQGLDDLSWADLVICVSTEIEPPPDRSWQEMLAVAQAQFGNQNCVVLAGGTMYQNNPDICSDFWFFFGETFRANHGQLPQWDFTQHRPYLLEALLGRGRHNRLTFFQRLQSQGLLDHCLVNLYNYYRSAALDQLETTYTGHVFCPRPNHDPSAHGCDAIGPHQVWASCLIAPAIYQSSWYSVVFETVYGSLISPEGDRVWPNFLTEKTAKVLYGSRIFVLFATPGRLTALKNMGFETFNDIVDESYDLELDDRKRFESAWHQVLALQQQDPVQLYQHCRDRLVHNQEHFVRLIQQPTIVQWIKGCITRYQTMAR